MADVIIPSAFVGIETHGTAYRMDHVPLSLKKIVDPPQGILSDEEILKRILLEVRRMQNEKPKEEQ
jgi:formylmethanofuran dehydrogenase subunit B